MDDNAKHVKTLSNTLRSMKFMSKSTSTPQPTRVAEEKGQWKIDVDLSRIVKRTNVEYESSYLYFTSTPTMGRKSFKAFNTDVEKMQSENESLMNEKMSREKEERDTIDDQTMAKTLSKKKKRKSASPEMDSKGFKIPKYKA